MSPTSVVFLAVGLVSGLRPEHSSLAHTANFAKLGLLSKSASSDPTTALMDAAAIVNSIMLEAGNATEYMSDDDQELLRSVVELIRNTIYGSMDSSDVAAENSISAAVAAVEACNVAYSNRVEGPGDLYQMYERTSGFQTELDMAQNNVNSLTDAKEDAQTALDNYMSAMPGAPSCPALPTRTKPALDQYFERSDYVVWYKAQQASYNTLSDALDDAVAALNTGTGAYDVALAQRDTSYCDWKRELEAACGVLNNCYTTKRSYYYDTLMPALEEDEEARMLAFKAGETVIAQINFLLGLSQDAEPPTNINTDRYELTFPEPVELRECGLEVLNEALWTPSVSCQGD